MKKYLFPFVALAFSIYACQKDTPTNILEKPYDKVCFLMTHNSMNNYEMGFTLPNQIHSITNQLQNGVRGLMLDTYDGEDGIALTYHGFPGLGKQILVEALIEIKTFLNNNPNEIVTIIFQNGGSNEQLEKAIDSIHLGELCYIHQVGSSWPVLQEMIDSNKRLVLFVEQDKLPRANYLMYAWQHVFDTEYSFTDINQFSTHVNRGGDGYKSLYLVNHWLQNEAIQNVFIPDSSLAPIANAKSILSKRVQDCYKANNHFINFVGVDFYEIGDAKAVVDSINNAN